MEFYKQFHIIRTEVTNILQRKDAAHNKNVENNSA